MELASDAPVAPGKITANFMTQSNFKLIVGSKFALDDGFRLVVLVRNLASYARLCQLTTTER